MCTRIVKSWVTAALGAALCLAVPAHAQVRDMKPEDVAGLPEYCPHTLTFVGQYGSKEGATYWKSRFGDAAYAGMHHYCWALLHLRRAAAPRVSAVDKRGHYNAAVSDIDFLLRRTSDDFPLLPEVLTRRGEANMHLKRFTDAENDYRKAIFLRSDYWPAYAKLAMTYQQQRRYDSAKQVLTDGIGKVSDPRVLKSMLDQLNQEKR